MAYPYDIFMKHRSLRRVIWPAVIVTVVLLSIWILSEELNDPPSETIEAVHNAFNEAEKAEARLYSAEHYNAAEEWLKQGEAELTSQRRRRFPFSAGP
jgi:flagellar biosynthesis/type III secretory pathway M-ring protein FliF/YscJ